MKKAIITLLCIIGCLQMNAQRVYNEEGKYYEMGIVVLSTGHSAFTTCGLLYQAGLRGIVIRGQEG